MLKNKISILQSARLVFFAGLLLMNYAAAAQQANLQQVPSDRDDLRGNEEKKSSTLEDFMKEFRNYYADVYYSFQSKDLKTVKVWYQDLSSSDKNYPDRVLKNVLETAGLTFEKVNSVYVIRISNVMAKGGNTVLPSFLLNSSAVAQTIKGKVVSSGTVLQGVTVSEKGTANSTLTDARGNFSLQVKNLDATLVFSSIGYLTLEVALKGRSDLSIELQPESKELEGVVVTALGITRDKKSLGYSVGQIKGEDMNRVSQTNVLNSMAGKVAGVTISSTGSAATSSVSMVIRGIRSLNNDNQPLFVIDGVPVQNTMNNITSIGNGNDVDYGNAISDLKVRALRHYMVPVPVMVWY